MDRRVLPLKKNIFASLSQCVLPEMFHEVAQGLHCSLSLWRAARGSKHMFLELIHGLFIT